MTFRKKFGTIINGEVMREVEIIALNHQGLGIAKVDGKVVFVENALVGEIVLIKIVKEKKNYSLANVI